MYLKASACNHHSLDLQALSLLTSVSVATMSRPTISISKFVGTIGLGLLTVSSPSLTGPQALSLSPFKPQVLHSSSSIPRVIDILTSLHTSGRLIHPLYNDRSSPSRPSVCPARARHLPSTPYLDIAPSNSSLHPLDIFATAGVRLVSATKQASIPSLGLLGHRAGLR